jgi:hypothetical protein
MSSDVGQRLHFVAISCKNYHLDNNLQRKPTMLESADVSSGDWLSTPSPEEFPIEVKGAFLMKNVHRKWWLAGVMVLGLATAAFAGQPANPGQKHKHKKLPEGGSAVVYLLGTGITCLGAMLMRSRFATPKQF